MAYTYAADHNIGGKCSFLKVFATTTVLTGGDAAATIALDAIMDIIRRGTAEPFIVGAPYNSASGSAVLFVLPYGAEYSASALQVLVRATGLTGLTSGTVGITTNLVG